MTQSFNTTHVPKMSKRKIQKLRENFNGGTTKKREVIDGDKGNRNTKNLKTLILIFH